MTCPRHLKKMEERTAKTGWQYLRCPSWTCFLFCGKANGKKYMSAVRKTFILISATGGRKSLVCVEMSHSQAKFQRQESRPFVLGCVETTTVASSSDGPILKWKKKT